MERRDGIGFFFFFEGMGEQKKMGEGRDKFMKVWEER